MLAADDEPKPEEDEMFVVVDEVLDVDLQLEQTALAAVATSSQPLTPSKMMAADDDSAKKTEVRSVDD